MSNWRTELRALAALGETDLFPLLVYDVKPPTQTPWPSELVPPSLALQEFYGICDGCYLGGHYGFYSIAELLAENRVWWGLLKDYPRPGGGPIFQAYHIILAQDECGHPLVWDSRTDRLAEFYYRDEDTLEENGPTLDEFLSEIFGSNFGFGFRDEMWEKALKQFRELI